MGWDSNPRATFAAAGFQDRFRTTATAAAYSPRNPASIEAEAVVEGVGNSEASPPNRDTPGPPRQHREHPHDKHLTKRALPDGA